MAKDARESFLSAFSKIFGTGSFHSTGTTPFFFPLIEIKGLGELAFPLPVAQAKALVAVAQAAPYGHGTQTVLDEKVRKCWQLDASQVSLKSPQWKKFLAETIEQVRKDLGIKGRVSAHPYKLLLYGKGGHFKAHRDTEKLDAMFGTLVIALPSAHQGGRLLIRHDGREIEMDFSKEQHRHEFQHAAFFADCEHEVEPVRSGYRCCLVYNLRLDEGDPGKLNLSLTEQARSLLPSLARLKNERTGEPCAVLLEHAYTEANLSLRKLKGNDPARAHALFAAAREAGFVAHLALVTYHKMGELDDDCHYGRRRHRSRYQDDDHDEAPNEGFMGEVYDESLAIEHWRDARNRRVDLGSYLIEPDRIISHEKLGDGEPDEKESDGFTGNAGCTMDYWYRRAAIILWAQDDHERILCHYNFRGACAELADLAAGRKTGPGSPFQRLGEAVVACFPDCLPPLDELSYHRNLAGGPFVLTLGALAAAGSRLLLDHLLGRVPASAFLLCDAALWAQLHQTFGIEPFEALYGQMIQDAAQKHRPALFQILDALLACKDAASWANRIASQLARLEPIPAKPSYLRDNGDPMPPGNLEEARILLAASHLIERAGDRKAALALLKADSSLAYTRGILGPCLLDRRLSRSLTTAASLAPEILAYAKDLLTAEVERPLLPYPDWKRPCPPPQGNPLLARYPGRNPVGKDLESLCELAKFMADPTAKTHEFRRAEAQRTLLETFISDHFLDLDHLTIRKGTPYTLACTKNDKSHHHALAVREKDKTLRKKLSRLQGRQTL